MRSSYALILVALVLVCGQNGFAQPSEKLEKIAPLGAHQPAQPMKGSEATQGQPVGLAAPNLTGKVLETMDASTYTYIRLKTATGEKWAAVPHTEIKVGEDVTVLNGTPMYGFESKTLGRKFDEIIFGTAAHAGGAQPSAADQMASMKAAHGQVSAGADGGDIKVERAAGPDAKTVAEIFEQKDKLKGSPVTVRAKVVKFSAGIMGKNWLHLQDGTGSKDTQTNDVTVNTQDQAAVGDVVTVKGKVQTDVNLGAGYSYPVLIEEATVTKQ